MRPVSPIGLALCLLLASLAGGARSQDGGPGAVRTVDQLVDLGVYDVASGTFRAASPGDGFPGNLVFDSTDASNSFYSPGPFEIHMDQGVLPETNGEHVVALGLSYATSIVGTVDFDVRLHSSTTDIIDPGKGIVVPLRDMPGAPESGQVPGYIVIVPLPHPYLLSPGPIRFTYQVGDDDTGPILCQANPAQWGTRNRLYRYKADGTYLNDFLTFPAEDYDATFYLQLYTEDVDFDDAGSPDATLARKDKFLGSVEPNDTDVLLYDAVAGERLKLRLATSKQSGLQPYVEVVDVASGQVVASAGDGSPKVKLVVDELPATGPYMVRVSGLEDSSGEYKLKFAAKVPKQALKPEAASEPSRAGGTLVAFTAKAGDLLKALVKPVSKTAGPVDPPILQGPVGPVEIGSHLQVKGGSRYLVKKLPLPVSGAYELRAGEEVGPGTVAKVKLKPPKPAGNEVGDLALELAGTWLMEEFVTPARRSLMTLDLRGKHGESGVVRQQDQYTITRRWSSWEVGPAEDLAQTGARLLTFQLDPPVIIEGFPPIAPPVETSEPVTDRYTHVDGDPHTIVFNSGVVWRRDFSVGPAAPEVEVTVTDGLGSKLPDGQTALLIECVEGAAYFDVHRAPLGSQQAPFFPVERHRASCAGSQTVWIDAESGGSPGGSARYWVRAVDAAGNMGPLGMPVDS